MAGKHFSFQTYDKRHSQEITKRAKRVRGLYDKLANAVSLVAVRTGFNDPEGTFSLSRYPEVGKIINGLIDDTLSGIQSNAEQAVSNAVDLSGAKNDALSLFLAKQYNFSEELTTSIKKRNESAQKAIKKRIADNMELSERVWNLKGQLRGELELALEVGLGDGKSAQALSRDVRRYLREPNNLFRRVRDKKNGVLRLSKAAAAHPTGKGVYRSSYKNALRMTGTETNIAYRTSDHGRWGDNPMIIGVEIRLSGNHPVEDMCDALQGVYPKSFKFTGWHPQCRCFAVPKLVDDKEFEKMASLSPEEYYEYKSPNRHETVPAGFDRWVEQNRERAKGWKNKPYFIKDNEKYVDDFRVNTYTEAEKVFTRHGRTKEAMRVALEEQLKKQYPGLENTEIAAIYHYTQKYGSSFRHLNKSLREGRELDKFEEAFSELLSNALSKLPSYKGEVYRVIDLNKTKTLELIKQISKGETFVEKGYMSTTASLDAVNSFAEAVSRNGKRRAVIFHIEGMSGKPLGDLSMFNGKRGTENQHEVLFDMGCKLKLKKYSIDGKNYHIYAEEI